MNSFYANGQPLEWHDFHFDNHGFASTESDGYQPYLADLTRLLVTEFLGRELFSGGQSHQIAESKEQRAKSKKTRRENS